MFFGPIVFGRSGNVYTTAEPAAHALSLTPTVELSIDLAFISDAYSVVDESQHDLFNKHLSFLEIALAAGKFDDARENQRALSEIIRQTPQHQWKRLLSLVKEMGGCFCRSLFPHTGTLFEKFGGTPNRPHRHHGQLGKES